MNNFIGVQRSDRAAAVPPAIPLVNTGRSLQRGDAIDPAAGPGPKR